jgi:hypothetical protein
MRIWGGARLRYMMSLMYAISFLCLLRLDEVLRIEARHVRRERIDRGWVVELTLDYRKTHQAGGKTPKFRIKYANLNYSVIPRNKAILFLPQPIRAMA